MPWRHRGSGGTAPPFLSSALDGDEWSTLHSSSFSPAEGSSGAHSVRGCVGPRYGLDAVEKREILHCWESKQAIQLTIWCRYLSYFGLLVGRSVKLLLGFTSAVIPGFSLHGIRDNDFCSLLDICVFRNVAYSVGRLNCCWTSSAQSFLASVSLRSMTTIFILS
jgi:hypothetical protein